jgi:hypothetical protein
MMTSKDVSAMKVPAQAQLDVAPLLNINTLIRHSSKTTRAAIAMAINAIGCEMFRDSASLEKNER